MKKRRRRFRKMGWTLVVLGLVMGGGFWGYLVPVWEANAPDYVPHLSPQGFWEAQERALKLGRWRYSSGYVTGFFGRREWAETIIGWVRDAKEVGAYEEKGYDEALAHITNHHIAGGVGAAAEWQRWWEANRECSQEEWIQQGFAEVGIEVALPPEKEDWPKLLLVLGAAAGPGEERYRIVEALYPDHVCYNAYRWLRDSGFDPVTFLMSGEGQRLSLEQRAGLLGYREHETILATPPPPGRLALAAKKDWGWIGRGPEDAPWLLKPVPQAVVTGVCLVMVLGGLWLVGLRMSVVRPED